MDLKDSVVAVTGGGSGIGASLCRLLASKGAKVAVLDINLDSALEVAGSMENGLALRVDVSDESEVQHALAEVARLLGPIDIYVSNAGIAEPDPSHVASASNESWEAHWGVNVMAHVYAARILIPDMIERGGGRFVITASAAGVLSQIGSAVYSVTKHAAVGFAEALAIAHGDDGLKVSVVCPQAVRTPLLGDPSGGLPQGVDGIMEPDTAAEALLSGMQEDRFMILPHPEVATYMQRKAGDYDRWIGGMQRFRRKFWGN